MTNLFIATASILSLILAVVPIRKNGKSLSNLSFAWLSFVMGIWAMLFIPYNYPFLFDSLFWIKAIYILVCVMVGAMLFFGYAFPYGDKPNRWAILIYSVLNIPIIYMILFTNLFVASVHQTPTGPETVVGPYYWYGSLVWSVSGLGIAIYHLVKKFKKATGKAKFQLLYMFLGLSIFGIAAAILDGLIPIIFHTSRYFSLSAVFTLAFVGMTAYSIARHRLLDIRVALQEVLVFSLTTFLISGMFLIGAISYWTFTGQEFKMGVLLIIVILSSLLTLIFEKVTSVSKIIARNFLGQSVYDYQKVVRELGLRLSTSLDLQRLIDTLIDQLVEVFKLKKMAILLYDHGKNKYLLQKVVGFNKTLDQIEEIFNSFTSVYFPESPKIIDLEEIRKLSSGPVFGFKENSLRQLATIMDQNELSLIIPLVTNNKIIGIIVIGEKTSLDPYTVQDINFLNTMAFETSIAFQNAKSYEEIQKFNITLTKEVEDATRELKHANEKLKVLDKLKDDFVSIASHELRTPMTAIRSYAWMALNRSDVPLSDKLKRYLIRVFISTQRLINLVNDMLNISRIESGKIEIKPEPVDVLSLVRDIIDEVYYSKSTDKKFQFEVMEKPVPKVFADPDKLRQVLLNLVGNSIKFTPQEGKITFDFFTDGKTVEISIKDTGVGISKEDLSKLFHKFSRLDNSYTALSVSGGTGLGLYISKNLIELMHGTIKASSEGVGHGTTVTITLPVANSDTLSHADQFTIKPRGEVKGLEPVAI
ncbi:hypothetical protein A3C59_03395 [Candidatus Daviesbacteria bacterium RIFCSPHIGHO2_02_FULL_36_13]|uniref:histidine kinase n=1 Tax=Candidatus Daviesbacteria bacterium RIFCSPHIGHO2_02_FULL_36_13 TaxID=1797768 RepID=A0A1F5JPY5_9BACT|nr:MAG: hypothetical protein A3C59_03395 [Candidatus Daviesbacteria bacterium RIFCSPHIGHO2_02_FULL_36_13]